MSGTTEAHSVRLLKANDIRDLGSKVIFNFEDLQSRCENYLDKVRDNCRKMVADAHEEAVEIRKSAQEQGQTDGYTAGVEQAKQEFDKKVQALAREQAGDQLKTTLPALQQAIENLKNERECWLAEWETAAVRVSVMIAEKVLRDQIEKHPQISQTILSDVLQLAAGTPKMKLKLHPRDLKQMGELAEEFVTSLTGCAEVELIADDEISAGGCVIETHHGVIDARLETQLERIMNEILQHDI